MIQLRKEYYFICIFLCVLFLNNTVQATQSFADSLYQQGHYYEAAIEYERIIYKSGDYFVTNEARYKKSECYKHLNDYTKGLLALQQIVYRSISDSLHYKYRYQTALLAYLSGHFKQAQSECKQLQFQFPDSSSQLKNIYLLTTLVNNEQVDWDAAYHSGLQYLKFYRKSEYYLSYVNDWNDFYEKNIPKLKNQKIANILRMIPGFGQIYAGGWAEGIFNFVLNGTFLTLGVDQVLKSYFITGYFTAAIPISKFYFGGHKRTRFLLEKTNYTRVRNFNDEVKDWLINLEED